MKYIEDEGYQNHFYKMLTDKRHVSDNSLKNNKSVILQCDNRGFYVAKITDISNLKGNYIACKLDGLIKQFNGKEYNLIENETHWLMYRKDKFIALEKGQTVRFKIRKIAELFLCESTRNIYPNYVELVGIV